MQVRYQAALRPEEQDFNMIKAPLGLPIEVEQVKCGFEFAANFDQVEA